MKQKEIINKLTNEEKAAMLSGKTVWQTREIDRLDIPSIFCADGPHGIRKQAGEGDHLGLNASLPATCFPTAATIANSWNDKLGEEIGKALGEEAASQGVNVLLGPGLNIKRSPLCGRNFEYFSEDPYLSGKMAAAYIKGIQGQGVCACPKHFAVNSQEERRMAMNAVIDERTLREIYLTGFEIAVEEGKAGALMTSYNQVNGQYANENKHLLQDILRDEWGFEGMVITDWGGSNDHVEGVKVRSNLEMPAPGLDSARQLLKALEEGRLSQKELDQCTEDLLNGILKWSNTNTGQGFDQEAHHKLAQKAAAESIVLLKNQEDILPLRSKARVALIGDFAIEPRYQGAGSSMVNPTRLETMEEVIKDSELTILGCVKGYERSGKADAAMRKAAIDLAEKADVVLFCFGLDELSESEGIDRSHMRIPQNQIELLEDLGKVNPNIVGVLSAGSAIEMPWQHCLKGILHTYLGGQAGARAILDIVTGKENPSGRLAESYPIHYEDTPGFCYFPAHQRDSQYRESLFVGYRYYDSAKVRVLYPFGYGLSYSSFEYTDLKITEQGVSCVVKNTSQIDGAEVVQLYIGKDSEKVFRPEKELKGYQKVFIKAGESQEVQILFDDKSFRYWNVKTNRWEIEAGEYHIYIGASSMDIKLTGELVQTGTGAEAPYIKEEMEHYFSAIVNEVSDEEYKALLGKDIPNGKWEGEIGSNDAICQLYYAKSGIARFIYKRLTAMKNKSMEKGKPDLNILFIYNMPLRAIAKMTGGAVSSDMVNGMVTVVNGHFFKGIKRIIGGFFTNRRGNKRYEDTLSTKK